MSPEKMIELAMAGKGMDLNQDLCAAFSNGFPIENLRVLITSEDQEVVRLGSYLVYELGRKARSILDDIIQLLGNDDPQVRGDAIVALGQCTTKFDAYALGKVIELLGDPDPFVQRLTMRFLQCCEHEMFDVGLVKAAEMNLGSIFVELLSYLNRFVFRYRENVPVSADNLKKLLCYEDQVAVRLGVVLAARPRSIVDLNYISLAQDVEDDECRNILQWAQERPCLAHVEIMKL